MHNNFSPFLSKITRIHDFGGSQGGRAPLPIKENFVFGELNMHNFRPLFQSKYIRIYDFFWGGLKDTPTPTQNTEGTQPLNISCFLSLCYKRYTISNK